MRIGTRSPENLGDSYESSVEQFTANFDGLESGADAYDTSRLVEINAAFAGALQRGVDEGKLTALGRFTYLRDIARRSNTLAGLAGDESTASHFQGKEESYADICLVLASQPSNSPAPIAASRVSGRKK